MTLGLKTKLVTYCHYWPVFQIANDGHIEWDSSLNHSELAEVILLRILGAFRSSDHFFVTSQFAKSLLLQVGQIYNFRIEPEKAHILPCPADPLFISQSPRKHLGGKTVLYNHRLYKQYGTEFFIDLASHFEGAGVQFVVTDFFSARNAARRSLDPNVDEYRAILSTMRNVIVREDGHIRAIYRNDIVDKVDMGVGPFRLNANWSMGAVDCLGLGIPVACPNIASFPEFVPEELLFCSKAEAIALIERLISDKGFWTVCSRKAQLKAAEFSADSACEKFICAVAV